MKFGRLMEHRKRYIFLKKLCRKWGRETISRPLFVFLKSFILGENERCAAWFHHISIALKLACNRNKLFKTLPYWSIDTLNFDCLSKTLGIVSPAHFVHDFSTKMFRMLCSINWLNSIVWLSLYWEICVLQLFVNQVVTSWILKFTLFF